MPKNEQICDTEGVEVADGAMVREIRLIASVTVVIENPSLPNKPRGNEN